MSDIQTPPNSVTQAGLEFNYSVWTPGTVIQLCNVPWTSDYRDIVLFDNQDALDKYLIETSGPVVTFNQLSYAKPGHPVNISLPFNAAYKYNYLRVTNPMQPIDGNDRARTFYYFITDIRYIAPNTTELRLQLDVWQTFVADIEFGRCYIERGHIGVANADADALNGREYLTIPEGLDTGNEYAVKRVISHRFIENKDGISPNFASVVIVSTVSLSRSGGTVANPVLESSRGVSSNMLPSGAEIYLCETPSNFMSLMHELSSKPWVTQGIIAAYLVPPMKVSDLTGATPLTINGKTMTGVVDMIGYPRESTLKLITGWRQKLQDLLPARYRHLTKLLTYPYSLIELTMHNGTPLLIKPECIKGADLDLTIARLVTPPNPRVMVYPTEYNDYQIVASDGHYSLGVMGEYLDFATGIINPPQIPIVNNGYLSYMASHVNAIAYQHTSADWSQQRALQAASVAYDQSTGQIGTNEALTRQSVNAATESMMLANDTALYRGGTNALGAVASGLGRGNIAGAAGGFVSAAIDVGITQNQNTKQTAISNQLATNRTDTSNRQSAFVRDTNKDYADWAARGDYSTAIAGINARVQDAKMIQPTISGQIGGDAFNFAYQQGYVLSAKMKMVDHSAMNAIGEFWLRYGYAINRFSHVSKSKLLCMEKFAYWKVKELYISSSTCPETYRQTVRGIFEKGVTVWSNPLDIATLDLADNAPKTGITL